MEQWLQGVGMREVLNEQKPSVSFPSLLGPTPQSQYPLVGHCSAHPASKSFLLLSELRTPVPVIPW